MLNTLIFALFFYLIGNLIGTNWFNVKGSFSFYLHLNETTMILRI